MPSTAGFSAAGYLEAAVVIDNRGDAVAAREFDRFKRSGIAIEPVTLNRRGWQEKLTATSARAAIERD
jgi:uncharacterized protein with PIN domain